MHMALTPELQKLIERRVKSGKYATPEDVVTAALHSLDQDEKMEEFEAGELDRLLAEGEKSGESLDGETVLAELRRLREQRPGGTR